MAYEYPYWRVVLGFSLTPLLAGVFFVLISVFPYAFPGGGGNALSIAVIMVFLGEVIFLIPALCLGVVCATLKLRRSWGASAIVFFLGGGSLYLPFLFFVGGDFQDFLLKTSSQPVVFFLGSAASFIMSWFVLPKHEK